MIAEKAGANISMIRYYFGNKEGIYEEMIHETLKPLLDMLDGHVLAEVGGLAEFLRIYYLALNQGVGPPLHPAAAGTRPRARRAKGGSDQG